MSSPRRSMYAIIARREFVERIRDRGFIISTAITLVILVGVITASSLLGKGKSYDLAVTGTDSEQVGEVVVATGKALGIDIRLIDAANDAAAESDVKSGAADAALEGGSSIVIKSTEPTELVGILQAVSLRVRSRDELLKTGLTEAEVDKALNQPPLPIRALKPLDARHKANSTVAFVGVLALYGQLFAYGYWVAAGVVEEKSSRVVEVLLATVRPSQLLRGKIIGIGILGLCQLMLIGVVGLTTARLVGSLEFPSGAFATIGVVLMWFVLGYFFYATLFSVAGAIVPRQEDLQSTMTPLSILIVASLLIGINAIQNPDSTLAAAASFLPFAAPLVMPSRMVLGQVSAWQELLSAAISIGATALIVPIATRVYARAVLRPGRVRIRQVLRAERAG